MINERSLLVERAAETAPLLSICIPQFNRTSFLMALLRSIEDQTFREVEICVSDGGSNDGRANEILMTLQNGTLPFRYARVEENLPYDANLRSSVHLARGHYCLLFGNDDALADRDSLEKLSAAIREWHCPQVIVPNYLELSSGTVMRRVKQTGILGAGPEAAVTNFRNFSFVSGLVLGREQAQKFATEKWDGSEMYQMYLACRILAAGGRLLGLNEVLVHKDIQITGESADSYARRPRLRLRRVQEQRLPLSQYGQVAFDAISPYLDPSGRSRCAARIMSQVLLFTYPPWLLEYRRVQTWRFAAGVALGMRPAKVLSGLELGRFRDAYLRCLYGLVTVAGLLFPKRAFELLRPALYALAKR